jgi:hypothetical protein
MQALEATLETTLGNTTQPPIGVVQNISYVVDLWGPMPPMQKSSRA